LIVVHDTTGREPIARLARNLCPAHADTTRMPARGDWTIRTIEDDLGRTACELVTAAGLRVCFELVDGGGYCDSLGVWRVAGWW
jgi:hypothetical protein